MAVKTRFDLTTEQENKQRRNSSESIGKFLPSQSRCGKVMFLHLSVSHSVHLGCLGRHPPGRHPLPQKWPLQRTVRILLECIPDKHFPFLSSYFNPLLGNLWENAMVTQCDRDLLSFHCSGGTDDLPLEEKEILRKYLGMEEAKQRR